MNSELEQRLRERAYHIWEAEGRPNGRDRQHWHQAEHELAIPLVGEAVEFAANPANGGKVAAKPTRARAASSKSPDAATRSRKKPAALSPEA